MTNKSGSWIECINPFHNPVKHSFFRYIPSDHRFNNNDKAKLCPICWHEAKIKNGTLVQVPHYNKFDDKERRTPESDTL